MVSTSLLSAALLSAALGSLVPPPLSRRALFAAAAGLPALTQLPASALAAAGTFADEEARAVGRWGERLLYETLRELGEEATWVNELQEQGLPFDVILERTPPTYIEVKSTVSRTKQLFQLSVPELRFAEKMGEQYTVYRVYGAGSDDVSLASLRNLAQHLADGSLGLFVG